ncbi:DELLA protein GAI1 [Dichanthelium oligosanthes]|uniref:DELLA protein GAI1 n=1 Tax=Dichanthelium oligosanthes TaxID=888268 RepID=A0A1E5VT91_9POAL|nr:DELLA protein GAI1 [Dichanthelium oligosanthes]
MDPAAAAAPLTGNLPPQFPAAAANGVVYCLDPALFASIMRLGRQPGAPTAAEVARQRQEEEDAGIRLVHLLVTCTGAIQAGDYSAAHTNLTEARAALAAITTSTGIGRVAKHFVDALAQRLFPAYLQAAPSPAAPTEVHNHFNDAGPYLRFAHSTANQAILDAFEGCDCVHIVDLAIMQGLQWPALIHALSSRGGGPPHLRITGIGGAGDELGEVGFRLEEFTRSQGVPFTFREVRVDQLDGLREWMLGIVPGEALAFNSILQLHRLLVDPDADPAVPAPIDTLLHLVTSLQPRVFTVVEQEADHNRPTLVERFTNAIFHYGSMFDSMEAMSRRSGGGSTTSAVAEAYLRAEILDIISGEGSARAERHEPMGRWHERLARAGLTQVPFGLDEVRLAKAHLTRATFSGSGFGILECAGSLALAWHDRPLYAATAWRVTGGNAAGAVAVADTEGRDNRRRRCRNSRYGGGESSGRGNWAAA